MKTFQSKNIKQKGAIRRAKKEGGFTLLELLVVVGIMAVIGGAMIGSFGGQQAKAARGTATQTLAGIENLMRVNSALTSTLPNNLESLVCLDTALATHPLTANVNTAYIDTTEAIAAASGTARPFGGLSDLPQVGGGMGKHLADKMTLTKIGDEFGDALISSGITSLRFAEVSSCDDDDTTFVAGFAEGTLATMNIPNHAFEEPRPGAGRNRGRGFEGPMDDGTDATPALMIWNPGPAGYNNLKVGAAADDVLVGLGLGLASSAVAGEDSPFAKAPFYGDIAKDKFGHYILLVNMGSDDGSDAASDHGNGTDVAAKSSATLQAVVDARGDFLDEEFAEFTGQKT
ncbi:MAG: type II secretion system GspH family protein [Pseudomonadales bacterium]|nr:type II secretion system GspH family protein [Pseudomonadales bacterium]